VSGVSVSSALVPGVPVSGVPLARGAYREHVILDTGAL
jgi:hypothetical protein